MKTSDQYTANEWKALSRDEKVEIKIYEATGKGGGFKPSKQLEKMDDKETDAMLAWRQKMFDENEWKKQQEPSTFAKGLADAVRGITPAPQKTELEILLEQRIYDTPKSE